MNHDIVLFLFVVLDSLSMTMSTPYFSDYIINELGKDTMAVSIAVAVRALCTAISVPMLGAISDKVGRRPVAILVVIGAIVTHIMELNTPSFSIYLLSRLVFGLTRGGTAVANSSACDIKATASERSEAIARTGAAVGVAFLIGAAAGGFLVMQYGFMVPTFVTLVAAICNLIFVWFFFKETKSKSSVKTEEKKYGLLEVANTLWRSNQTRELLMYHILLVLCSVSVQHAYLEYMRLNLNMSPSARGLVLLLLGITSAIAQGNLKYLLKILGGSFNTMIVGLIASVIVNFASPLLTQWPFVISSLVGTFFVFLSTLSLGLLSKKSPQQVQGSIMGLQECLVNLGGVLGPVYWGLTADYSHVIPFWTVAFFLGVLLLWTMRLTDLKEQKAD